MTAQTPSAVPSNLLGRWIPDAAESGEGPFTELEFLRDGKLRYALKGKGLSGNDALVMDFRTEGQVIVTRPPGATSDAKTRYEVGPDGSLTLEYGGHKGRYVRAN
ncbi:MAG TPA: hypothetical protein VND93_33810 [Myxococcales bacterium]|nr:hypothetical protein [Myxococcales bacterium]